MRIVAGAYRGRKLRVPPGSITRPTTERVREALFNILSDQVIGARVLDLYAGSGALGIEALSRGASKAVFVDASFQATNVIRSNLAVLDSAHRDTAMVVQQRIDQCLPTLASLGPFDLCLIDPPFAAVRDGSCISTLERVAAARIMHAQALWVLEFPSDQPDPEAPCFAVRQVRPYGDTRIAFMHVRTCDSNGSDSSIGNDENDSTDDAQEKCEAR